MLISHAGRDYWNGVYRVTRTRGIVARIFRNPTRLAGASVQMRSDQD